MNEVQMYLGDCIAILRMMEVISINAVITDPPYPDYHTENYQQTAINFLDDYDCKQLIFWSAKASFPLEYTAIHIWDKGNGIASMYERIIERNGQKNYKIFRKYSIDNKVRAMLSRDVYTEHPSQKPIQLMRMLVEKFTNPGDTILDPFMGSGTTGVACVQTGRNFIGIEIEPKYFEIAEKRIAEAQLQMRMPV